MNTTLRPYEARWVGLELWGLNTELASYVTYRDDVRTPEAYQQGCLSYGADYVEEEALYTFARAETIISGRAPVSDDRRPRLPPHSPLTRAALALAERPDRPREPEEDINDVGCLAAELYLMRSLGFLASGAKPDPNHHPAAVLFDRAGEPFAFLKSSGLRTAYAWRDALMAAGDHDTFIPRNSWIRPQYGDAHPLLQGLGGKGLVRLVTRPDYVEFVRHSANLLPPPIPYFAYIGATARDPTQRDPDRSKLQENLYAAVRLNPDHIASQVHALLRRDSALTVV
jgi:hypothetical protein